MSLILEALRRSEAERRRGQTPSLLDGLSPARVRTRPLWPVALAGLFGGLLLAAAVAWWLRPAALPAALPPRPAPVAVPIAAPIAAPVAVPVAAPIAAPVAAPVAPPPTPSLAPIADPTPAPPSPPTTSLPMTPAPILHAAPEADPHLGPRADDLAVADLSAPLRAGLPPLRLSMHVFAEDPARRFAIVDGARLREGEALADGLQVLEIRRDGLRLAWQGRTLWLPR